MNYALFGAFALAIFSISCSAVPPDNIEIVNGMVQAMNQKDFESLREYVSPNVVRHSAATPGVTVTNIEQFIEFLEQDVASVPDSVQTIEMIFGAGDKVAARAIYTGTQTGQMGPFPPSGKYFEIPFNAIMRIEDGKVAEIWVEWDNLNALAQLGHLPAQ